MTKKRRILVFTDPKVSSIIGPLSQFAEVRQINWSYRFISQSGTLAFFKVVYRTIEGLYWLVLVIREILRFRADVVIAQYAYFCGLIGSLAAKITGKPFLVRAVGSDLRVNSQSLIGRISVLLTFRFASGVICVSKDLEFRAQELGARSTVVIPSPLMLPLQRKADFHKKAKKIVTVSRLIPIKGLSHLVRAMAYIKEGSLIIIGDGPERGALESLSKNLTLTDRVLFTGWINDKSKILDHLKQATVFVLPSLSEGRPRAIIEAMACGLPIIATNVGGIPEIVVDGVNGLLVSPKDEMAIANAIEQVLNDIEFQKRASAENIDAAKQYLSPVLGQKLFNYLEQILRTND